MRRGIGSSNYAEYIYTSIYTRGMGLYVYWLTLQLRPRLVLKPLHLHELVVTIIQTLWVKQSAARLNDLSRYDLF